jgi:hypothetical protein
MPVYCNVLNEFAHVFDSDKTIKWFESYDDAHQFTTSRDHDDDFDGLLSECWTTSIKPIHEVILVKDYQLDHYPLQAQRKPYYREIPGNLVLHTNTSFAGGENIHHLLKLDIIDNSSDASCKPCPTSAPLTKKLNGFFVRGLGCPSIMFKVSI